MQPVVRQEVYDAYWRFACERQAIFHRRLEGKSAPWTDDPILATFKFCNVYRASDRVSQYLIRNVIYGEAGRDLEPEDVFLRVILFRLFSKESTWDVLEAATGGVRRATLDVERLGRVLDELRRHRPIYTAAFILCAHDAYGQPSKHRNHLMLVKSMFSRGGISRALGQARTMRDIYDALVQWPMLGPFMGYQLAVDLNYTGHVAFSENDFTVPGPGAVRGLKKVFRDFGGLSPSQLIMRMVDRQDEEFGRLRLPWRDLFTRPLHAIDCQGLFCEIDKYSRVRFPELRSNRQRIKATFAPTPAPLPLFYPPKWEINERMPDEADLSPRQLAPALSG